MSYTYKEFDFNKDIKRIISLNIRKYRKLKGYYEKYSQTYNNRTRRIICKGL